MNARWCLALLAGAALAPGASLADASAPVSMTAGADYREIPAPAQPDAIVLNRSTSEPGDVPEIWFSWHGKTAVRNVHVSTLTPFLPPKGKASGAAVVLAPGGAFRMLAMGAEGETIARWLNDRGVAVFVLKYRLRPTSVKGSEFVNEMAQIAVAVAANPQASLTPDYAFDDGLAALALVRANAAKWGVDPRRVGFAGFSAGARLSRDLALRAPVGRGPDFAAPIYGPMFAADVPQSAPPLFTALAVDDPVFGNSDFGIIKSWKQAGKPIEVHIYQSGGHGFGAGIRGSTNAMWMEEFYSWLRMNKFVP